jgi:hypothetical protein
MIPPAALPRFVQYPAAIFAKSAKILCGAAGSVFVPRQLRF